MSDFLRVSKHNPCPVCQNDSWCTYSADGNVVKCVRVQSENACENRDGSPGWLHFDQPVDIVRVKPPEKPIPVDAAPIAKACYGDPRAQGCRDSLAEQLGVSTRSLDLLRVGVGEDEHDGTPWYSFPSRDGDGNVIGITRRYSDGAKKTYKGTSNGVFYTPEWHKHGGVILIVEGASDVAACETNGLSAIGRSSNVGGANYIKKLLDRHAHGRKVVVIGEHDEKPYKRGHYPWCPKECTGCAYCFPGLYGAKHVSKLLGVHHCMPPKPYKDFRETAHHIEIWADLLRCM